MPDTFALTPAQREVFDRAGVLRLPAFFPVADIEVMADRLWADLGRRFGIVRDRPETWTKVRPGQFQALERSGAFDRLESPTMMDLADALLGAGAWERPGRWGQPLVTFPSATCDLPRAMWHLDYPVVDDKVVGLSALKAFTFLEPVLPRGGGTLYVSGSHHLAMEAARVVGLPAPSAKIRERLRADHAWFAQLWAAQGDKVGGLVGAETHVRDLRLRVEEMTGDPGDLVIMHPALLHGLSHNALDRPRMMLAQGLVRAEPRRA